MTSPFKYELDPVAVSEISGKILELIKSSKLHEAVTRELLIAGLKTAAVAMDEATNAQISQYVRGRVLNNLLK